MVDGHRKTDHAIDEICATSVLSSRRSRIDGVLAGRTRKLVVVLENLTDSHNLSAAIRSAEGFGIQEIHVVETGGPLEISPRVTQGCHKWLELHGHPTALACVDHLHERGYRLWAAALEPNAVALHEIDFRQPTALVFGNEKLGLSRQLLSRCDGCYRIPMRGFSQSFNVSVAAAVSLFYATLPADVHGGGVAPGLPLEDEHELRQHWLGLSVKQYGRIRQALDAQG